MIEIFNTNDIDIPAESIRVEMSVSRAALYEQLAEECVELAQSSLKVARIIRGENPTPASLNKAMSSVIEELTDISVVADVMSIRPDANIKTMKLHRWAERIREAHNND